MRRRDVLAFGLAAMWSLAAHAQAARAPRVGILFVGNVDAARHQGFVAAMQRLGYREGATIGYELRSSREALHRPPWSSSKTERLEARQRTRRVQRVKRASA